MKSYKWQRRWLVAAAGIAAASLASSIFWLGTTATIPINVTPPPAASATGGAVATVVPMNTSVSSCLFVACLDSGVSISKLEVMQQDVSNIRVTIAWTDVLNASRVLLNPHAQVWIGLYYPISTASSTAPYCSGTSPYSVFSNIVVITDTDGNTYCAQLDPVTGTNVVLNETMLNKHTITTTVLPQTSLSSTPPACSATTTTWCTPTSLSSTTGVAALFVVASIEVPAGFPGPPGQQSQVGNLQFFVSVNAV